MATAEVILKEKIEGLGAEADVVKVRAGYARNYLVPQGKASPVTPAALRTLNQLKARRAEREARELNEAQELSRKINKLKLTMTLETGETGKAFGSITAKDLEDNLKAELGGAAEIKRHQIVLEQPIKSTGTHEIPVKLHADVIAKLTVVVKSSAAEAEVEAKEETEEARKGFKAKAKARHQK